MWGVQHMYVARALSRTPALSISLSPSLYPSARLCAACRLCLSFALCTGDPLGKNAVTPEGFAHLLRLLMPLARGRVVLALEGGYNTSTVSYSAEACVRVLLDMEVDPVEEELQVKPATRKKVEEVVEIQRNFWPVLACDG